MHESHQPDFLRDLSDANVLSGKDLTEVDLTSTDADAATARDGDRAIAKRILKLA